LVTADFLRELRAAPGSTTETDTEDVIGIDELREADIERHREARPDRSKGDDIPSSPRSGV
jgi:hypothetical protein